MKVKPRTYKTVEVLQMTFGHWSDLPQNSSGRFKIAWILFVYLHFSQYLFMISAYIGNGKYSSFCNCTSGFSYLLQKLTIVVLSKTCLPWLIFREKAVLIYALNPLIDYEIKWVIAHRSIMIFFIVAAFVPNFKKGKVIPQFDVFCHLLRSLITHCYYCLF